MSTNPVWFDFPVDRVVEQMEFIHPELEMIHRVSVIDANVEIMTRMLEHNVQNRGKKKTEIARMTRDVITGDWDFNGNTFVFDVTGRMQDGQNRGTAIVNSGTEHALIMVLEGISPGAADSIDQGVRRKANDILTREGINPPYKDIIVSIAKCSLQATVQGGRFYSAEQVAHYAKENLDRFAHIAAWSKSMSSLSPKAEVKGRSNLRTLSPGALGALTVYMSDNGASVPLWGKFVKAVATGLAMDQRTLTTAQAVRTRITKQPLAISGGGDPYAGLLREFGTFVHTYNRWVKGELVRVVRDYTKDPTPRTWGDLPKPVQATTVHTDGPSLDALVMANGHVPFPLSPVTDDEEEEEDMSQGMSQPVIPDELLGLAVDGD